MRLFPTLAAAISLQIVSALGNNYTLQLPYISVNPKSDLIGSSSGLFAKPLLGYYSIPYVAPPTGDRRFRAPQDPLPNQGSLSLTDYGPVCPQPTNPSLPFEQSEDCLTLSIFRPRFAKSGNKKLPVVIWVPGGEFSRGQRVPDCRNDSLCSWQVHSTLVEEELLIFLRSLVMLPRTLSQVSPGRLNGSRVLN